MFLLTKSSAFLIGPIASLLGNIMEGIYWLQSKIGIENIGLCIILFTIVIYMLMTPLTYQQQKFSKLQAKMNPELQAVQKKYKGKKGDQAAMAKMNEETQIIYDKYGVNPMGSCLQLIIQMPILFALYRVIWNIPAYVSSIKEIFMPLAEKIISAPGSQEFMSSAASSLNVSFKEMTNLTIVDALYKFKPANWTALSDNFKDMSELVTTTQTKVDTINSFAGMNIAESPINIITSAFKAGSVLLVIAAILVPVLAALTQWINAKLTTASSNAAGKDNSNDTMAQSMKTMNTVMPLMSAAFCLTLPVGMGIYWIAGAVVRSIQQVIMNKHFDKIDMDEIVKKNMEKANAKRAKRGLPPQNASNSAKINTRNINTVDSRTTNTTHDNVVNRKKDIQKDAQNIPDQQMPTKKAKQGSLLEKAMMVKDYNDSHTRK